MGNNMSQRKCKDWLECYLDYTQEQESPSMFHLWVGLSVLSSALERKVYIDRGYYTLYPNLYVVLVGASARTRRTTAVNIGYSLFKEALPDVCLISQKITPEALISVLMEREKTGMAGGTIVSSELSVFLGSSGKDDSLIQLLTKLYDCEDVFDYHTMARGKEVCHNVYMCLIGSTTPDWIKNSMPAHAVGGGFTSRVIFVYQYDVEKLVPFPYVTEEQKRMRRMLVEDLKAVNRLRGVYELSKDAKEWYETWYVDVLSKMTSKGESALDGYYGRKHDTLLKVAMCIAASRSGKLVIEEEDLVTGLKAINANERYLPEVIKSVMATQTGEEKGKVFRTIARKGEVSFTDVLRNVSYCIDAKRLNEVLESLMMEELIEEVVKNGKRWFKVKRR